MKKWILPLLTIVLSCQIFISDARAEAPIQGPVAFPSFTVRKVSGGISGDQTVVGVDMRAGYRIASGFFFGMIYSSTSAGGTTSTNETAVGNTIGYFNGVFSLLGSVYLMGQSSQNTATAAVTRSDATGFQIDMSFTFPISMMISVGPVFSLKSLTFRKKEDGAGVMTNDLHPESDFSPYLGAVFAF